MEIEYSPQFHRAYKKLPLHIKKLAEKQEKIFRANPLDSRLRTHKLLGRLRDYRAFWIDNKHRIIFSFEGANKYRFHTVGDHSIYKRFKP